MPYQIFNGRTGKFLAKRADRTKSLWSRAKGLLGRPHLNQGEGLIMARCKGVDTCFMKFPLDLVFVDRRGVVVKVQKNLRPWKISGYNFKARMVLELPVGMIDETGTMIGDPLSIEETE
ncbi:MAG TPA: DUF192 domain-containing protein [Bdellovibrionota bacterium]|nr:DUF192 domain-containing protein [Bdellovibrionota bacterium]